MVNETVYSNGDLKIAVENNTEGSAKYTITLYFMNIGGESSFQWKLYDIEHSAPAST